MSRPTAISPEEQEQIARRIGVLLLQAAPEDWHEITVEYRATGEYHDLLGEITTQDGSRTSWEPPEELNGIFQHLRDGMYRPDVGTWLSALYVVERPSSYRIDINFDAEPQWQRPLPRAAYIDELRRYPRADENVPDWLRIRIEGGTPATPAEPAGPGAAPHTAPQNHVAPPPIPEQPAPTEPPASADPASAQPATEPQDFSALNSGRAGSGHGVPPQQDVPRDVGAGVPQDTVESPAPQRPDVPPAAEPSQAPPPAVEAAAVPSSFNGAPPETAGVRRFRIVDVFDGVDEQGRPRVADRSPVQPEEIGPLRHYLETAPIVLSSSGHEDDQLDPERPAAIPANWHTDGVWLWPSAVPYYLAQYGMPPQHEFLDHLRNRRFALGEVDESVREAAATALREEFGEDTPADAATESPGASTVDSSSDRAVPQDISAGLPGVPSESASGLAGSERGAPPQQDVAQHENPHRVGEGLPQVDAGVPQEPVEEADATVESRALEDEFGSADATSPEPKLPDTQATFAQLHDKFAEFRVDSDSYRIGSHSAHARCLVQDGSDWLVTAGIDDSLGSDVRFSRLDQAAAYLLGSLLFSRPVRAEAPAAPTESPVAPPVRPTAPEPPRGAPAEPEPPREPGGHFLFTANQDAADYAPPPEATRRDGPAGGREPAPSGEEPTRFHQLPRREPPAPPRTPPSPPAGQPAVGPQPGAAGPGQPPLPKRGPRPDHGVPPPPGGPAQGRAAGPAPAGPPRQGPVPPGRPPQDVGQQIQPLNGEPPLTLYRDRRHMVLQPGTDLDRFGEPGGNVCYAIRTPYNQRSLPPQWVNRPYYAYRVQRPVQVLRGIAVPWFEQPGGGTAYVLPAAVADLVGDGTLIELGGNETPPRPAME